MRHTLVLLTSCLLIACGQAPQPADHGKLAIISAADNLSATALTESDYRQYLAARKLGELKAMRDKPEVQQEMVLDYHSDKVLAEHARKLGLAEEERTRELLARASRSILIKALVDKVTREMEYPDESTLDELAREHYLQHQDAFKRGEKRRVAHILLKDQYACPCEVKSLAERVDDIYASLEAGEEFAELARRYSSDRATAESGGELAQAVEQNGIYLPKFTDEVFALAQPGDVSNPLRTRFGTHLIKLLEIVPPRTIPYEEVRDELIEKKREELLQSRIAKMRSDAYPKLDSLNFEALNQVVVDLVEAKTNETSTESH